MRWGMTEGMVKGTGCFMVVHCLKQHSLWACVCVRIHQSGVLASDKSASPVRGRNERREARKRKKESVSVLGGLKKIRPVPLAMSE